MAARIETQRYFRSHLKTPRGRGYWLFENQAGQVVVQHNGSFSEARAAALAYAKTNGIRVLYACP